MSNFSKICIHVGGNNLESFLAELSRAESLSELVELRVDYLSDLSTSVLKTIRRSVSKRAIFTCRASSNGGRFVGTEEQRISILTEAMHLNFDLVDVEHYVLEEILSISNVDFPCTRIIVSYHNFQGTPNAAHLDQIIHRLTSHRTKYFKVATLVNSAEDADVLLRKLHTTRPDLGAIFVGMGQLGRRVRLLAPFLGSKVVYCCHRDSVIQIPHGLMFEEINSVLSVFDSVMNVKE